MAETDPVIALKQWVEENKKYSFARFLREIGKFPLFVVALPLLMGLVMMFPGPVGVALESWFGVSKQLLTLLGMILCFQSLSLFTGFVALSQHRKRQIFIDVLVNALISLFTSMASAIREHDEILQETVASPSAEEGRERGEVRKQLAKATPEASLFRTEWETIPALVKESEDRLRGELRYSVNLVATIMLGFFAILIAVVLALLRK